MVEKLVQNREYGGQRWGRTKDSRLNVDELVIGVTENTFIHLHKLFLIFDKNKKVPVGTTDTDISVTPIPNSYIVQRSFHPNRSKKGQNKQKSSPTPLLIITKSFLDYFHHILLWTPSYHPSSQAIIFINKVPPPPILLPINNFHH